MATRTRKARTSLLDDRIGILNRDTVEASPAKQVFRTVSTTIALVRDKMIDDEDSVQLSEYCFNVCKELKAIIQGRNASSLDESVRVALEDLGRITGEIERALRRGASVPGVKHNKGKLKGYKPKIQGILNTFNTQSVPLDETLPVGSAPESACRRLARRAFALDELPSLIEVIFSSEDESDTIRRLLGDDAQAIIDVMDEALDRPDLSPPARGGCLKLLRKMCGRHALLPTTLRTQISFEQTGDVLYRGGFADVWKGEHCGRDVAVKVLRTYSNGDLRKVIGRFCREVVVWNTLRHRNVLPLIGVGMSETRFSMISDWMVNGSINSFVEAHPDADRLELLKDVARGLIYIHSQGVVHGDLKGANVLIDQTCHARLADFGLLSIISDPKYLLSSSSHTQGGTARWMSPERINPERFGSKDGRPTIPSDCYALGMVIYETISGNLPFHKHADLIVFMKVVEGERPPRGNRFPESLWNMLEMCWEPYPDNRPSIEYVLQCLEIVSSLPEPLHGADGGTDEGGDGWDSASSSSGGDSPDVFHLERQLNVEPNTLEEFEPMDWRDLEGSGPYPAHYTLPAPSSGPFAHPKPDTSSIPTAIPSFGPGAPLSPPSVTSTIPSEKSSRQSSVESYLTPTDVPRLPTPPTSHSNVPSPANSMSPVTPPNYEGWGAKPGSSATSNTMQIPGDVSPPYHHVHTRNHSDRL